MRTLLVIRHAKSEWPWGVPDHDRPLAARGRRDAPAVGRWLNDHGLLPQYAAVSSAVRTTQTWELIARELTADVPAEVEPAIYAAAWTSLLGVVTGFPARAATAAIVGHNPGCEDLAAALTGTVGDPAGWDRMRAKYPTAGVAVLQFDGDWASLRAGGAALVAFSAPRGGEPTR